MDLNPSKENDGMVTHGGRCPLCAQRTVPGIGSRAGYWICVPCQTIFDGYGHPQTGPRESAAPRITMMPRSRRPLV